MPISREAEKAIQLFDQLELIAKDAKARAALRPLLKRRFSAQSYPSVRN